jgi:hypothetical protein
MTQQATDLKTIADFGKQWARLPDPALSGLASFLNLALDMYIPLLNGDWDEAELLRIVPECAA